MIIDGDRPEVTGPGSIDQVTGCHTSKERVVIDVRVPVLNVGRCAYSRRRTQGYTDAHVPVEPEYESQSHALGKSQRVGSVNHLSCTARDAWNLLEYLSPYKRATKFQEHVYGKRSLRLP